MPNLFFRAVKPLILLVMTACLSSCATKNTNLEKQDQEKQKEMDGFVERSEIFNEGINKEKKPLTPRRELISFDYGPESLNNNGFLEYLVLSNAHLSSEVVVQLNEQEANFKLKAKQQESLEDLFTEIKGIKKKISFYKALNENKSVLYSATPIPQALKGLVEQMGYKINIARGLRKKAMGNYSGTYYDIMNDIAKLAELKISIAADYMTINFTATLPDDAMAIDEKFLNDVELIESDADKLIDMILVAARQDSVSDAKSKLSNQGFQSQYVKNIVSQLLSKNIQLDQAYASSKQSSEYRQTLIKRHSSITDKKTSTVANYDDEIKNGSEKVIEKFSVYNDTPAAMLAKLKKYSFFSVNCPVTTSADTTATTATATTATATTATTNSAASAALTDDADTTTPATSNTATTAANTTTTSAPVTDIESGCVSFTDDDNGVVAAGSINDVKLVEKFLVAQDTPVKQALIEAYILSVTSDWKLQLETALNDPGITPATISGGTYDGFYNFAAGLIDFSQAISGAGITASTGSNHIRLLVNFIETNQIGKKISNPVILVKNGEEAIIDQTTTLRNTESTTVTNASTSTTTSGTINEYEAPIKLTITPEINAHNDEIDLTFAYEETAYASASATAASTTNEITTKLKLQPGQVIMLAGLYQQSSTRDRDGLPGTSEWGLDDIFYPLTALFGGGQRNNTETGSELLVFINPSVITPANAGYTLQRAQSVNRTLDEVTTED